MTTSIDRQLILDTPSLYPKQKDAIYCKERYGIIEASTILRFVSP